VAGQQAGRLLTIGLAIAEAHAVAHDATSSR
jgi:hypothetical protein